MFYLRLILQLHDSIPLLQDMNEPANFGTNQVRPWNWPIGKEPWSLKCKEGDEYEDPPYKPGICSVHIYVI